MLSKISKGCVNVVQRFLPDPFIFCILLTMFVFVVAMPLTGQGPIQMVQHWGKWRMGTIAVLHADGIGAGTWVCNGECADH